MPTISNTTTWGQFWPYVLNVGSGINGLTASIQYVQDGNGNSSVLGLSTAGVQVNATTITINGFTFSPTGNSILNGSVVGNMTGGGTVATNGFTLTVTGNTSIPAINGLARVTIQQVTSTGAFTYTPTANLIAVKVKMQASGGNSGAAAVSGQNAACGAGAAGAYAEFWLTAAQVGASLTGSLGAVGSDTTLATTSAWTVPHGGNGGSSTGASGAISASGGATTAAVTTGTGQIVVTIRGSAGGGSRADNTYGFAAGFTPSPLSPYVHGPIMEVAGTLATTGGGTITGYGYGGGGQAVAQGNMSSSATAGGVGIVIFEEYLSV